MDITEELLGINLYTYLECDPSATENEIKTAYRKKALLCHPDKHPDNPNAAEMFKQLKSVVDLLLDQHKRMCYDRQQAAANRRKMDSQQRAQQQAYRQQRTQEESERQQRAQQRAQEEFERQQKAQQESYRQQRAEEEAERQQRAEQEAERQQRAEQEAERQQQAEQEAERQQNEPQRASYRDAGTSNYTPRQLRDIDRMVAALAALNKSHRDRMREQAKRRGMGRSKRPSCFSTNLDPNCRSFWTYPRPTPTSSNGPNNSSFRPRSTSSNLDPNSPIFHPRTMPGQTL